MCPQRKIPKRDLLAAAVEGTGKRPLSDTSPGRVQTAMAERQIGSTTLQRLLGVSDQTILYAKDQDKNTQVPTIVMMALELADDFGVSWLASLLNEPMYRAALITGALPDKRQSAVIKYIEKQYDQALETQEDGLKIINISALKEQIDSSVVGLHLEQPAAGLMEGELRAQKEEQEDLEQLVENTRNKLTARKAAKKVAKKLRPRK
jgi:hypothetical protein